MGAAVGALLVEQGHEVVWNPDGRSDATARRAAAAGLTGAEDPDHADVILSVCPPHAALDVARSLQGTRALMIDANAVSPMTARRVGDVIGERWVDGGIVGPPPRREGTTRLYLSGPHAGEASELFAGTRLEPVILEGSPVAASSLKMAYAAWTKGSAAAAPGHARQRTWDRSRGRAARRVAALTTRARVSPGKRCDLRFSQGVALGRRDERDRSHVRVGRAPFGLSRGVRGDVRSSRARDRARAAGNVAVNPRRT